MSLLELECGSWEVNLSSAAAVSALTAQLLSSTRYRSPSQQKHHSLTPVSHLKSDSQRTETVQFNPIQSIIRKEK